MIDDADYERSRVKGIIGLNHSFNAKKRSGEDTLFHDGWIDIENASMIFRDRALFANFYRMYNLGSRQ